MQIQRAAKNAHRLDLDRLYPFSVPRTSYMAATMILLFVGLNFIPLSSNHNWLTLRAAPALSINGQPDKQSNEAGEEITTAEKLEPDLPPPEDKDASGDGPEPPPVVDEIGGLDGEGVLKFQFEQQKLDARPEEETKPEDFNPIKSSKSKLVYRAIRSEIEAAKKDKLNQEHIPWEYRPLIKDYFQAIRPPKKK